MEGIARKALLDLDAHARPDAIEDDWIAHFFDKCRLISDDEMQSLWARVLAGEANLPGKSSKRTVDLLASLDKADAAMFANLCRFVVFVGDEPYPLVFDLAEPLYHEHGINFEFLSHLDTIGLIRLDGGGRFFLKEMGAEVFLSYFGERLRVELSSGELAIGYTLMTKAGVQLSGVCNAQPVDAFLELARATLIASGHAVESISPSESLPPTKTPAAKDN